MGHWLLMLWTIPCCVVGFVTLLVVIRTIRETERLADLNPSAPSQWPSLSLMVPACNEETTLEPALQTLLSNDYPQLQIVMINDRSTDATGEIIERQAGLHPEISPVHVKELPEGWLGKVHALERGLEKATGDFLLFTDADVHLAPGTLQKAVALMEERELDFLSLIPNMKADSKLLQLTQIAFALGSLSFVQPWKVNDPEEEAAAGIGAFNLVRRSAFEKSEGLSWLRMETLDDVGMGMLLKRSGARVAFLNGTDLVSVHWYESLGGLMRGLEKNTFGMFAAFQLSTAILKTIAISLALLGPVVALYAPIPWLWMAGVVYFASHILGGALLARWGNQPIWLGALQWLGSWLMLLFTFRSAILGWKRQGVVWRGTFYSLPQLRDGLRVNF